MTERISRSSVVAAITTTLVLSALLAAGDACARGSPSDGSGLAESSQSRSVPALDPRDAPGWTATAQLLGGVEVTALSAFQEISRRPYAIEHRAAMERGWKRFSGERLAPVAYFASREIDREPASAGPVYYPFSGPDVAYPLAMFPQARDFVLTGLEPVGRVPDLSRLGDAQLASELGELRRSLGAALSMSFFRTNDMRSDLAAGQVTGVTPLLLATLGRSHATIRSVEAFAIDSDTAVTWGPVPDKAKPGTVNGVRIVFRLPGDAADRRLHYFAADLADTGLERAPQYLKWVEAAAPKTTLLKAASYLMHKRYFSRVRGFIVGHSALVVQDDSGIPFRYFPDSAWEQRLYGVYSKPIALFADWRQHDLQQAYQRAARTMDLGIGYRYARGSSNLQVFVRRDAGYSGN